MKEFKGTPGPWVKESWNVIGKDGKRVMFGCLTLSGTTTAEVIANDNLVLSAPELLSALQEMVSIVKKHTHPQPDKPASTWGRMESAEAVIARALGE